MAQWLAQQGHAAEVRPLRHADYHVNDFLWWHAPGEGPARFVMCTGEQPGRRLAYWDPFTGRSHWRDLESGTPGQSDHDHRVHLLPRPLLAVPAPSNAPVSGGGPGS